MKPPGKFEFLKLIYIESYRKYASNPSNPPPPSPARQNYSSEYSSALQMECNIEIELCQRSCLTV